MVKRQNFTPPGRKTSKSRRGKKKKKARFFSVCKNLSLEKQVKKESRKEWDHQEYQTQCNIETKSINSKCMPPIKTVTLFPHLSFFYSLSYLSSAGLVFSKCFSILFGPLILRYVLLAADLGSRRGQLGSRKPRVQFHALSLITFHSLSKSHSQAQSQGVKEACSTPRWRRSG